MHAALQQQTAAPALEASEPQKPAVSIKKSVTPDFIICLEDGKQFKSLKRHFEHPLRAFAGRVPDEMGANGYPEGEIC